MALVTPARVSSETCYNYLKPHSDEQFVAPTTLCPGSPNYGLATVRECPGIGDWSTWTVDRDALFRMIGYPATDNTLPRDSTAQK